jgi:hypothetical protein
MFTAVLVTIAKLWNQHRCPSTNKWVKKTRYIINTMNFYSVTKQNEIMSFARKWMELESIILSKIHKTHKYVFSHMESRFKKKT